MLPGVVPHTFIIFGVFTTPNLCPLTQNPGDATDHIYSNSINNVVLRADRKLSANKVVCIHTLGEVNNFMPHCLSINRKAVCKIWWK